MNVIGLGAHDSLEGAQAFAESTGLQTPNLVWDGSGESWVSFGVPSQPAWLTFDANGNPNEVHFGVIDEATVKAELGV